MAVRYNPNDASSCWPAGDYEVSLIKVEESTSKQSGNPMEVWTFEAYHDDGRKQLIRDYVVIPAATFKIKQMAIALGKKSEFEAGSFQAEDYLGSNFLATLSVESSDGYDDQNKINKLKPASTGATLPQGARKPVAAGGSRPPFDESTKVFKDQDIPFAWSGRLGQSL